MASYSTDAPLSEGFTPLTHHVSFEESGGDYPKQRASLPSITPTPSILGLSKLEEPEPVPLAVNGTLMRGLKLEPNMVAAGAEFVREAETEPKYRLWTIGDDEHPAMIRVPEDAPVRRSSVKLEIWAVPPAGLASILAAEPPGLTIGKVKLSCGEVVLGVLGEAALCEAEGVEITHFGCWRAYTASTPPKPAAAHVAPGPPSDEPLLLAVNGTFMRGLKLEPNMVAAGATFVREAETEPTYRLWTIGDDEHPAMVRVREDSPTRQSSVKLEIWAVPPAGLASILAAEPPGLTIGKVKLSCGEVVLGVLGEPALCEAEGVEITDFGGWRAYMADKGAKKLAPH